MTILQFVVSCCIGAYIISVFAVFYMLNKYKLKRVWILLRPSSWRENFRESCYLALIKWKLFVLFIGVFEAMIWPVELLIFIVIHLHTEILHQEEQEWMRLESIFMVADGRLWKKTKEGGER